MQETILAYNNNTGRYGIRLCNSNEWINEGLSYGDKVTIFDVYNGYYVEDVILSESLGTTKERWYLKKTKIECDRNRILPVMFE
jgi:hypothetical protein